MRHSSFRDVQYRLAFLSEEESVVDQMERLEAEIGRAVETISQLRLERDDLKKQNGSLQQALERQRTEMEAIKTEQGHQREEVRQKIESMLAQLDGIHTAEGK